VFRRNQPWKPRRGIVLAVRRSAALWWTLTIVLALLTASFVGSSLSQARHAAATWGTERAVWVVDRPVDAGDVIGATDVRRARLPRGVVPAGALEAATSPVGEATRVALMRGEVVLTARLAGRGARGVAAMLAPGSRAIALPNDEHTPVVQLGDRVDVIATFDVGDDLETASVAAPAVAVATNAEVLAVAPRALTVAVAVDDASRVAFALAKGAVTVVLRSGVSEPRRSR
jgi:Flp pilus assembly protein CpaB